MDRRRGRRNIKPKKSFVQKCKDCLRQFIAFLFSNVGIICLVVGYTAGGAVMFKNIESTYKTKPNFNFSPNEYNDTITFTENLNLFCNYTVEILWHFATSDVGLNKTEFLYKVGKELENFQNIVVTGVKEEDYDGVDTYSNKWTISAAFLYCLTVITTIGKQFLYTLIPSI